MPNPAPRRRHWRDLMSKQEAPDAQKHRSGVARVFHAARYSWDGLRAGWSEPAFRQESVLAALMIPAAFFLGTTWAEVALLVAVVVLVLVAELLNTGIEVVVDRFGGEWHALSKKAKDLASAAVLLSLLLCGSVWAAALWARFGG